MRVLAAVLAALLSPACAPRGGAGAGSSLAAAARTPLAQVGARCSGGGCTCRRIDDYGRPVDAADFDEGPAAAGEKRFELRTGRGYDHLEITVAGRGTLVKSGETVDPVCGYIDLPPGEHRVRIRARATKPDEGMAPTVTLSEYGTETRDWYDTFAWKCVTDGPCKKVDLEEWSARARSLHPRGIYDPCGSTRVSGVKWQIEHGADQKVQDVALELVLTVYRFAPRAPHGTTCKGLPQETLPQE
jgi:hypothetical protein